MSSALTSILWVAIAVVIFLFVMPRLRQKVMGGKSGQRQRQLEELELSGVSPKKIAELGKELAARLAKDAKRVPKHELEITRHALWMAMLLEAGADDDIDDREVKFVSTLYGRLIANEPGHSHITDAGDRIQEDRKGALAEIAKAKNVSLQSKQNILWGAFLVSISNYAMEPSEAKWLVEIADTLAMNAQERDATFKAMSESVSASETDMPS
ncbi:MAG: hypothetical protein AAF362_04225 [Pseudomonadota bacterium]